MCLRFKEKQNASTLRNYYNLTKPTIISDDLVLETFVREMIYRTHKGLI